MTAPERIFLKEDLETGMLRERLGPDGADFIVIGLDDYAALAAERDAWKDAYDRAQRLRASDLERLTAEKEAVEKERDALREQVRMNSWMGEGYVFVQQRAEAAEARAARMEEALRFYADEHHDGYDVGVTDYGLSVECGHIIKDGGQRARAVLTDTPREGETREGEV